MIIISFLLQSVPEALSILLFSLSLFGFNIKKYWKKSLIYAFVVAAFSITLYEWHVPLDMRVLLISLLSTLLIYKVLNISIGTAFLIPIIGFIIQTVSEYAIIIIAEKWLDLTLTEILRDPLLKIALPWGYYIPLIFGALLLNKRMFRLKTLEFKNDSQKLMSSLIIIGVFQLMLLLLINYVFFLKKSHFPYLLMVRIDGIPWLTLMIGLLGILNLFVVQKLGRRQLEQAVKQTENPLLDNIEKLVQSMHAQNHDFYNHVQVLYGLIIREKDMEEAQRYLETLYKDVKDLKNILDINNPVLSALLNSKATIAEMKGIRFKVQFQNDIYLDHTLKYDLVKILGNLIDNAIEVLEQTDSTNRTISVHLKSLIGVLIIEVINNGSHLEKDQIDKIFESGYTTKGNGHAGLGLAITKDLVKKYQGEIDVDSTKDQTTFMVVIPLS